MAARMMAGLVADSFWQWHWNFDVVTLRSYLEVAFHFTDFFEGRKSMATQRTHQGACSQICCGESLRALGQKVPLGDRKTLALEPSAKHKWSCGSGVLVLCSSKVMP